MIYQRYGTKAILLHDAQIVRELDRSYYCAESFEYPVALFTLPDGRVAVAHCPRDYNHLEIEVATTGESLSSRVEADVDFFHSRLSTSSDGLMLASAGWVWHPFSTVHVFDVLLALSDSKHLGGSGLVSVCAEVDSVCFDANGDLIVATTGAEALDDVFGDQPLPLHIGVWSRSENRWRTRVAVDAPIGTMMPIGDTHVVSFHGNPKLVDHRSGKVEHIWSDIPSSTRSGAIRSLGDVDRPVAFDSTNRRFAVADDEFIHVVTLG